MGENVTRAKEGNVEGHLRGQRALMAESNGITG